MEKQSSILKEEVVYPGKWLRVVKRDFSIDERRITGYECVDRNRSEKVFKEFDGVSVAAILTSTQSTSSEKHLILIAQFRPPVAQFVLEFPAGLVEDSNILENAARELEEETGYIMDTTRSNESTTRVNFVPISVDDPGMCSGSGKFIVVYVDADDPRNAKVTQKLDDSENIRVHVLPLDEHIEEAITQLAKEKNYVISTKTYSFAVGFSLAKKFASSL